MQDFINIFNQILYLIKNNYLKKRIETEKIQSSFFFIKIWIFCTEAHLGPIKK